VSADRHDEQNRLARRADPVNMANAPMAVTSALLLTQVLHLQHTRSPKSNNRQCRKSQPNMPTFPEVAAESRPYGRAHRVVLE
jgi:hypothetical protein